MRAVVIVIGLPAAGKTTYVEREYGSQADWAILSGKVALGKVRNSLKICIGAGRDAVIDACHLTKADRRKLIDDALGLECAVDCVWLATPLEVCLVRNAGRPIEARIKPSAIKKAAVALEPPTAYEGFRRLRKHLVLTPAEAALSLVSEAPQVHALGSEAPDGAPTSDY